MFLFSLLSVLFFFFFNDTATTEIYTLSLHDALPIWLLCPFRTPIRKPGTRPRPVRAPTISRACGLTRSAILLDRKSTRLNSSHSSISYAVFCLKKKKNKRNGYMCQHHTCL